MVLPLFEEEEGVLRIRAVRNKQGKLVGYQDPDNNNRFLSRVEASKRLLFRPETSDLEDSFGNHVGVGGIRIPASGIQIGYVVRTTTDKPLDVPPQSFQPRANQQLVERVVFAKGDGTLVSVETSYKLGEAYNPAATGGRWRQAASNALDLPKGKRLPTADLQRAVIMKEFIVRTIT